MEQTPKGYKLVKQFYPLPNTREERTSFFTNLISSGGIKSVLLDAIKGFEVKRWVLDEKDGIAKDIVEDSILADIRNTEMEELEGSSDPFKTLFTGFSILATKNLQPTIIAMNSLAKVRKWLKLEPIYDLTKLFNVPTVTHKSIPDNTLLISASENGDENSLKMTIKIDMSGGSDE